MGRLRRLQDMSTSRYHSPTDRGRLVTAATALGLVTVVGCGLLPGHGQGALPATSGAGRTTSQPPPATTSATATPSATATGVTDAATRLLVTSATFVSASTGWALGVRPCPVGGCPRLQLRKTIDHGRRWFAVPAPPAPYGGRGSTPAADAVSGVRFADTADGWAFGPGLWATHDGGRTWHRVGTEGLAVVALAAGGGRAIATLGRCQPPPAGCASFRVYSTPVTADRWRAIPGTAGEGSIGSVTIAAGTGYVTAVTPSGGLGQPAMTLLSGPADGSATWRRLAPPCPAAFRFAAAVAATPRSDLAAGCGGQPGAGNQLKRAYYSADGGRTWRRLTSPPVGGYLTDTSITPAGTIMLSGDRMDVYISWEGGRAWRSSPSLNRAAQLAGAGFSLDAAMTTNTQGFAIQHGADRNQMWFTYDGGHTWVPVTLH